MDESNPSPQMMPQSYTVLSKEQPSRSKITHQQSSEVRASTGMDHNDIDDLAVESDNAS